MDAVVLYDVDDIRLERRDVPQIADGELLVQTRASGICSGDVMAWYVRRKAPLVLGHEPAGIVAATGDGVEAFRPGDRVFVHHHAPCFACEACERGDYVQCATWRATALDPGGMAEYFRVPQPNLRDTLLLPAAVSFADASLVEPLACVLKSLRRGGLQRGDRLHVIGLGIMGILHALAAQSLGAHVSGSDFNERRRAFAATLGVEVTHPNQTKGGARVVICGPGSADALRTAVALVAAGGSVVMFTPLEPGAPFEFDANELYFRDVKIVGSYSCGPKDTREALDLIARGIVTAKIVGATFYRPQDAADAYQALRSAAVLKPIILFE